MQHLNISKNTWKELKELKDTLGNHDFNGTIKELIADYYAHFEQETPIDSSEKIEFTE